MVRTWSSLRKRAGEHWQVPALLLSGMLLTIAVLRLRPSPVSMPLDEATQFLKAYVDGGVYGPAIDAGWELLHRENEQDTEQARAPIRQQLARAMHGQAAKQRRPLAGVGGDIVEQYTLALEHAAPMVAGDFERMGEALEWTGRFGDAVDAYTEVVARSDEPKLDLRRHIYLLVRDKLAAAPGALDAMIESFLRDAGERLPQTLWALHEKLYLLEELGRLAEGTTLLLRKRERFEHTDLFPEFRYLEAFQLYQSGAYDESEALLRTVRNSVSVADDVHAKTGWLLGRVIMHDAGPQRPMEALAFFEDVIQHHGLGPYTTASRVGTAEALAYMQRHRESVNELRTAIEEMAELPPNRLVSRDVLRVSLTLLADALRKAGELGPAVEYSRLAGTLIDWSQQEQAAVTLAQLAQLRSHLAQQLERERVEAVDSPADASDDEEARRQYRMAGETRLDLARLNVVNEGDAAQNSWQAADDFARAGDRHRAIELFKAFAKERPDHALVARALLRIGQLEQAARRLEAAADAYRECYRRYPRTLDGARALVPLAQCYLGLGPDNLELAERTLHIVLKKSQLFTPEAPEFADALFLLGDTQARRGGFENAVATLEEALDRYPDDPRTVRARYLLADAYRQSGLALKAEVDEVHLPGEIEQIRVEATSRFRQAASLFRRLIELYEKTGSGAPDRLDEIYRRHAYLYEADSYFEMQRYGQALKLYEDAAGMFKDQPAGLAAYVQMINCHVFLGQPEEALAALARVSVLVDDMPQLAFDTSASPETRQDWKRYFQWLSESELLQPTG